MSSLESLTLGNPPSLKPELISVIVPVYNVEAYLDRCVRSILAQTYQALEVILVDDGSTDGSSAACDAWVDRDGRVRVIHKRNGGLSSARNAGIDVATGEFVTFVDSDDYIDPDMFCCLYNRIEETKADMALTGLRWVEEGGRVLREEKTAEAACDSATFWEWEYPAKDEVAPTPGVCCVVAWNKLYRRKLFASERYDVGKLHEDEFILHRIVSQCATIATAPGCYYNYVQRVGSITNREKSARQALDATEAICKRVQFLVQSDVSPAVLDRAFGQAISLLANAHAVASGEEERKQWSEIRDQLRRTMQGHRMPMSLKGKVRYSLFCISPSLLRTAMRARQALRGRQR